MTYPQSVKSVSIRGSLGPWIDNELRKMPLDNEQLLEFQLIFACARASLKNSDAPAPQYLQDLLSAHSPDWNHFLELVNQNRLIPFVYKALHSLPGTDSHPLLPLFRQRWHSNSAVMLRLAAELARLHKLFAASGIPVIAFKGPALSMQMYGQMNMRYSNDLDILVAPDDFEPSEKLLLDDGYTYLSGEIPFKRRVIRTPTNRHTHFVHHQKHMHVELHYSILHYPNSDIFCFDYLWQERASVSIMDHPVCTLSLPLHALYLSIHGEHHSWERMGRLYDIAAIADQMNCSETAHLMDLAQQHAQQFSLTNTLLLCQRFFGLKIFSGEISPGISPAKINRYARLVLQLLVSPKTFQLQPWNRIYWLLLRIRWQACQTVQTKSRLVAVYFMPNATDIARFPLPDRLYVLHYLLRPFWVLQRRINFLWNEFYEKRDRQ